jgi:hypothetical protein
LQIGLVLKRIRIDPKRYLAAMKIPKDLMFENQAHCDAEPALWITAQRALDKLLYFDIAPAFATYYVRGMVAEIELGKDRVVRYARAGTTGGGAHGGTGENLAYRSADRPAQPAHSRENPAP